MTVVDINVDLFGAYGESSDFPTLEIRSNGHMTSILFLDFAIWDSEEFDHEVDSDDLPAFDRWLRLHSPTWHPVLWITRLKKQ